MFIIQLLTGDNWVTAQSRFPTREAAEAATEQLYPSHFITDKFRVVRSFTEDYLYVMKVLLTGATCTISLDILQGIMLECDGTMGDKIITFRVLCPGVYSVVLR